MKSPSMLDGDDFDFEELSRALPFTPPVPNSIDCSAHIAPMLNDWHETARIDKLPCELPQLDKAAPPVLPSYSQWDPPMLPAGRTVSGALPDATPVPQALVAAGPPVCSDAALGKRKYTMSWVLQEVSGPRPIEGYEVYGPQSFLEPGSEPADWTWLVTLPPLQSCFVLVEEVPLQQEVMKAADKIARETLPIAVYAVNGKGYSEPLVFELPWASRFHWLQAVAMLRICMPQDELKAEPQRTLAQMPHRLQSNPAQQNHHQFQHQHLEHPQHQKETNHLVQHQNHQQHYLQQQHVHYNQYQQYQLGPEQVQHRPTPPQQQCNQHHNYLGQQHQIHHILQQHQGQHNQHGHLTIYPEQVQRQACDQQIQFKQQQQVDQGGQHLLCNNQQWQPTQSQHYQFDHQEQHQQTREQHHTFHSQPQHQVVQDHQQFQQCQQNLWQSSQHGYHQLAPESQQHQSNHQFQQHQQCQESQIAHNQYPQHQFQHQHYRQSQHGEQNFGNESCSDDIPDETAVEQQLHLQRNPRQHAHIAVPPQQQLQHRQHLGLRDQRERFAELLGEVQPESSSGQGDLHPVWQSRKNGRPTTEELVTKQVRPIGSHPDLFDEEEFDEAWQPEKWIKELPGKPQVREQFPAATDALARQPPQQIQHVERGAFMSRTASNCGGGQGNISTARHTLEEKEEVSLTQQRKQIPQRSRNIHQRDQGNSSSDSEDEGGYPAEATLKSRGLEDSDPEHDGDDAETGSWRGEDWKRHRWRVPPAEWEDDYDYGWIQPESLDRWHQDESDSADAWCHDDEWQTEKPEKQSHEGRQTDANQSADSSADGRGNTGTRSTRAVAGKSSGKAHGANGSSGKSFGKQRDFFDRFTSQGRQRPPGKGKHSSFFAKGKGSEGLMSRCVVKAWSWDAYAREMLSDYDNDEIDMYFGKGERYWRGWFYDYYGKGLAKDGASGYGWSKPSDLYGKGKGKFKSIEHASSEQYRYGNEHLRRRDLPNQYGHPKGKYGETSLKGRSSEYSHSGFYGKGVPVDRHGKGRDQWHRGWPDEWEQARWQ